MAEKSGPRRNGNEKRENGIQSTTTKASPGLGRVAQKESLATKQLRTPTETYGKNRKETKDEGALELSPDRRRPSCHESMKERLARRKETLPVRRPQGQRVSGLTEGGVKGGEKGGIKTGLGESN